MSIKNILTNKRATSVTSDVLIIILATAVIASGILMSLTLIFKGEDGKIFSGIEVGVNKIVALADNTPSVPGEDGDESGDITGGNTSMSDQYVPANSTYTTASGIVYTQGERLPETPTDGDILETPDYYYGYNITRFDPDGGDNKFNTWVSNSEINASISSSGWAGLQNGWSVVAKDKTKTSYEELLDSIGNKSVTNMFFTYYGCTNMQYTPQFPENVKNIHGAFANCKNIVSVNIPYGIINIEETFSGCSKLQEVLIPYSVISIAGNSFSGCSSLSEIEIPLSVEFIGDKAFFECNSLETVRIPLSVRTLYSTSLSGCNNLKEIIVDEDNNYYSSVDGVLYNKEHSVLYTYPSGKTNSNYDILDGTKTIGSYAFLDNSSIKNVYIPNSVTDVKKDAFCNCVSLEIQCPQSLKNVIENNQAFNQIKNINYY